MTLGPNQIAWCRKNIASFDLAWRQLKAADDHKTKVYKEMGVEPGAVNQPTTSEAGKA